MKITQIEAWEVKMGLKEPYTIAYETVSSAENVFLRMETDKNIIGYGCAAPDLQITGETTAGVLKACADIVNPRLKGADPLRHAFQLKKLQKERGRCMRMLQCWSCSDLIESFGKL